MTTHAMERWRPLGAIMAMTLAVGMTLANAAILVSELGFFAIPFSELDILVAMAASFILGVAVVVIAWQQREEQGDRTDLLVGLVILPILSGAGVKFPPFYHGALLANMFIGAIILVNRIGVLRSSRH